MYLCCAIHGSPSKWKSWLPLAELWYNTSYHSSLGSSPFMALYGSEPGIGAAPTIPADTIPVVRDIIQAREAQLLDLKHHLQTAQNRMKITADRKRVDQQFHVGEQVLLKLQPYTVFCCQQTIYPKLAFKYFGHYQVIERVGAL